MADLDSILKTATRSTRTIDVCVAGKEHGEYADLGQRILELQKQHAGRESLAGIPEVQELAARMDELKADMQAATFSLTLQALLPREFTALMVAHPPREDRPDDVRLGVNQSTFFEAVLPVSAVEPELTPDRVARLIDVINQAEWAQIMNVIWTLNLGKVDVPFLQAASLFSTGSEES